ncbi:MAG TPA: hypothetical protein DHW61_05420, partial [Lachnoclostridium phytofermentans]|nr:hypothetical protein [Lachnoclostridium phytofermentans]
MFQSKKRWISMLLVSVLCIGMLAGCSKGDTGNGGKKNDSVQTNQEGGTSTKPVEISMFVPSRLPEAIYDENTLTFKTLADKLDIKLSIESVVHSEAKEKFSVIISGGKYPDVMAGSVRDINTFGMSGAFIPLNDLIEEHAPNIKKYLLENKEAMAQAAASDGKIYGIPM